MKEQQPRGMLTRLEVEQAEVILRDRFFGGRGIDEIADTAIGKREGRQRWLGRLEALQWILNQSNNGMTADMTTIYIELLSRKGYIRANGIIHTEIIKKTE